MKRDRHMRKHMKAGLSLSLIAAIGLAVVTSASGGVTEESASQAEKLKLPKEKETALGLYVTAKEAYEKWKAEPDNTKIIDVRTPEEYLFVGHPPIAWKIPLAAQLYEWDAAVDVRVGDKGRGSRIMRDWEARYHVHTV
jgi:hypothetical protein